MSGCVFNVNPMIGAKQLLNATATLVTRLGDTVTPVSNGIQVLQSGGATLRPSSGVVAQVTGSNTLSLSQAQGSDGKPLPWYDNAGDLQNLFDEAADSVAKNPNPWSPGFAGKLICAQPAPGPSPGTNVCDGYGPWNPSAKRDDDSGYKGWEVDCGGGDNRVMWCPSGTGADINSSDPTGPPVLACKTLGCANLAENASCYSGDNYPQIMDGNCSGGQCVSIGDAPLPGPPRPGPPHHGPQPPFGPGPVVPPHHGPVPHPPHHGPVPHPPHHGPVPHPYPPHHEGDCHFVLVANNTAGENADTILKLVAARIYQLTGVQLQPQGGVLTVANFEQNSGFIASAIKQDKNSVTFKISKIPKTKEYDFAIMPPGDVQGLFAESWPTARGNIHILGGLVGCGGPVSHVACDPEKSGELVHPFAGYTNCARLSDAKVKSADGSQYTGDCNCFDASGPVCLSEKQYEKKNFIDVMDTTKPVYDWNSMANQCVGNMPVFLPGPSSAVEGQNCSVTCDGGKFDGRTKQDAFCPCNSGDDCCSQMCMGGKCNLGSGLRSSKMLNLSDAGVGVSDASVGVFDAASVPLY